MIIPLEAEVLLSGFFVTDLGFGEAVFKALPEASGEGGDIQSWVLGMSLKEIKPGVRGDGSGSVEDLLDGWRRGGDIVFDLFVDVDDLGFIVGDDQGWGGRG